MLWKHLHRPSCINIDTLGLRRPLTMKTLFTDYPSVTFGFGANTFGMQSTVDNCKTVKFGSITLFIAEWLHVVCSAAQHSTAQHSTAQHSTAQHRNTAATLHHLTVQPERVQPAGTTRARSETGVSTLMTQRHTAKQSMNAAGKIWPNALAQQNSLQADRIANSSECWQACQHHKCVIRLHFNIVTQWAACVRGTETLNTSDDMRHPQDQETHVTTCIPSSSSCSSSSSSCSCSSSSQSSSAASSNWAK